jgi:hypothetical protein
MRISTGLLTMLLAAGCKAGTPANAESADCTQNVERAHRTGGDSLFTDARGLVQSCPDAMALALAGLWAAPVVSPEQAHHLRAVSALVRDERLVAAIQAVVSDPARPIETRVEGLSTLSYYLQAGRWVEFTFLKTPPDSASLRMFMGMMDKPLGGDGTHPIPPEYAVRFRQMLETLRQSDSSSAMRSAARRFLLFLDYSRQQLEQQRQQKQPPATTPPPSP